MSRPSGTAIEPSFVQRVADGFRYALTGATPSDWFGPLQPIEPALSPEAAEQAGVAGRQLDYRTGFNVDLRPRSGEAIGFPALRALADNFDLLRLVIETRKDQVCALGWSIKPRDPKKKPDDRCKQATDFLQLPDGEHCWEDWLRMVLEDLFVLDAPTIYARRTLGGSLFALEPIDGATIKRVIDTTGRTPQDGTAYQQILKGVPAVDYTRDELIYRPRNLRTHKVYGYSPVEQIIVTVNTAIRRALFTQDYFTSGTVPDALAGVPSEWTITQIKEFQDYWDLLLMDDQASRRKLKFVPGEIAKNFKETKQPPLKDEFDEWLARVTCFAFSIEPTPFIKQQNRATAQTAREQSLAEGLAPIQQWVKSLVGLVLAKYWNAPDLELAWEEGAIVDPLVRAQVAQIYVAAKVLHPDEVRADMALDPLTPEQRADMNPPPPAQLQAAAADAPEGTPGKGEPKPVQQDAPPKDAKSDDAGKYLRAAAGLEKKKLL